MSTRSADFVIIGAGSAGCAMASRLSEDGKHTVLVLEHGGTDAGPFIQMPAALSYPMNMSRYDWGYVSEPEPGLAERRLVTPRGKVVGGSSSINGMVYVRGHAKDFDHWREQGADGWGFADVLPYYKRMETWTERGHGGDPDWRGKDGPLHVTRGRMWSPLFKAFIEAGKQAGYPVSADYNGEQQEGFAPMEMTVKDGVRWSAFSAYLKPALKRPNCEMLRCLARRIVIENGKAVGVEISRGGSIETVRANREVIIAASSINSPAILKRSGIGPAAELKSHGIDVVADRPGVGENLQDHLELYLQKECLQPITLYKHLNWISKLAIGAQWLFLKQGHGTTNHFEAAGFIRSAAGIEYPDIQYHFLPVAIRYDGKSPAKAHGFQVHVGPMRSKSRGNVTLRSADPEDAPVIRFNYMSHEDDWRDFRTCIRLTREIFEQDALEPYAGREITPGADVASDEALDAHIAEHAESAYHPCGTCRMGRADDINAVVDPQCRVIGVENLRLADSSIFPRITNGNLNGPSIMVGEKAADHILGKEPLPADNAEPWINPNWRTSQR